MTSIPSYGNISLLRALFSVLCGKLLLEAQAMSMKLPWQDNETIGGVAKIVIHLEVSPGEDTTAPSAFNWSGG